MVKRFAKLLLGVFLYAVGIVLTINANLGLAPWDVFHQGLSIRTGITMGQASIFVGFVFVILDSFLGEKLGWGTLLNIVLIGTFVDILMLNHLLPFFNGMAPRFLEMVAGMIVIGIASYYYISAGLGSGPRDGLMVALTKRTTKSVRFIRNCIELCALAIGFFLGGSVGMGTLIMALSTGYFVQFAFKLFGYNVKETKHKFIDEDIKCLYDRFFGSKEGNNEKRSELFDEGE